MSNRREIRLCETADGTWTATEVTRGITVEGENRAAALDVLDELVAELPADSETPLGDRLEGMADDLDLDSVDEVREVREET